MADADDLARELLERARDDLRATRALLSAGEVSDAIVGFHAQQAVEKALEAALAVAGAEFPFTQNLAVLMQLCDDAGLQLPDSLSEADLLTPYAAQLRYGGTPAGTVSRERALGLAGDAIAWTSAVAQVGPNDRHARQDDA